MAQAHMFNYQALPMRVVMGPGSLARLGGEIDQAAMERVLVLCSPEQQELGERVADLLGERAAGVHPHARTHVPLESAEAARDQAKRLGADGCVAVGGGSAIGLGKAVALEYGLRIVAVPTTYAGSEMTSVWGLTENGRKRTGRDPRALPVSVVYDPELTVGLSAAVSATSGMNALAHAVESLYAPDTSPIVRLMAEEGVRALAAALPEVVSDGFDLRARGVAQYGAWLCGACLGATSMGLHHKLCHVLGGTLDLPHAPTHTVVLPHALAYNQPAVPEAVTALSRALGGTADPARALWELGRTLGTPRSLAELGMPEEAIHEIVGLTLADTYPNPRTVTAENLTHLLRRAWAGEPPAVLPAAEKESPR
ncbi:maleylacetate reductase [Streptomyces sp. S3(2020)]|uniref:maleylacetate reductase n=1 Tax=Streptomyces sp. S3(2020) TaxID=2732044 RepID=UPI0014887F91|nr:maleylacetate reductase [Streptomyces sp. S3(2020)]NNN29131.1 maleylacetate reductase [Streptomyces sp. S3(2020)]